MTTLVAAPRMAPADTRAAHHLGEGYEKRRLRFIRRESFDGWRLKVYGIATPGRAVREALVEATVGLAREVLPRPALGGERSGVGFLIAHDAATMCFGLVYWWQGANELHQRCYWSQRDNPARLAPIEHPAAGCVWEMGVIDFERRAWIEDVLADPQGPDIERYLSRELDAEV